jgi:cell division protein FtsZ
MAREQGILTVGVVTKPFQFEGSRRMSIAEEGVEELQKYVDTLIVIPNQNLFRLANEKTTFADAFAMADNVLHSGVRGITDLMVMPGLINLDFADVRTVMMEMGKAMMGTGEAEGDNRALEAAEAAISNPLLDEVSMKGAHGVLINITGGEDLTLFEVDEAANRIRSEVDPEANIIVGSTFNENLSGSIRVSVFATGIEAEATRVSSTVMSFPTMPSTPPRPASRPEVATGGYSGGAATAAVLRSEPAVSASPVTASAEEAQPETGEVEMDEPLTLDSADIVEEATPAPAPEPATAARAADSFFAPRPMEPERSPEPEPRFTRPDPFAEAAMANGTPQQSSKPSLFERMTGRARKKEEPAPERTPRVSGREEVPMTLRNAGSRNSGGGASEGEDQIDIPAFLRRQAN